MSGLVYRRDIDGLRAMAILPVVLFHFGFSGFSGGFVGVDVFFVISGFLITSIIWRERQAGRFSFIDFWTRRARRILPTLVAMTLAVLVAGWWLLTPEDYSELGRSVRYQAIFGSNFYFMRGHGYFAPASAVQPLLHTWSLAVEEQFYLVFPLLLALLSGRLRRWRETLVGLALLSFALSLWAMHHKHGQAAFYMLPMRAWELLLGALLALAPAPRRTWPGWVREAASAAGLLAILGAVFGYSAQTPFPGPAALLPTLGAVALIWANGGQPTWVGRLLGSRLLVGIGLISYAWYLWHWPLLVFAEYLALDPLTLAQRSALVLVSALLGYASWRWLEGPFRQRRWLAGQRPLLGGALASLVLLALVGQLLRSSDGVPGRLSEQALRYARAGTWQAGQPRCLFDRHLLSVDSLCHFGPAQPPLAMVWGDSHAAALTPAWREQAQRANLPLALAGHSACPPIEGLHREAVCEAFNATAQQLLAQPQLHDVILAAHWTMYVEGEEDGRTGLMIHAPGSLQPDVAYARQQLADGLRATVERLRAAGKRVWLVKEAPEHPVEIAPRLTRLAMLGLPTARVGRPQQERDQRQAFVDRLFEQLSAQDAQVRVLDPTPLFCADGRTCLAEDRGEALYRDTNHLSDQGGLQAVPLFDPVIAELGP
ncbi:acyltransferase family protein [Pseudomonas sp. HR96]|uniref:acyltransferase family protein n=1 Tax=Pseudomonas sp. HR96 TaxID=1027966 RepID=UPI002A74C1F8|nr:acyltransferase family protein [Pseudomonas sp. HR96]WPO99701.1 acyltransferase family protein [Pseudomonas sp. HR96]